MALASSRARARRAPCTRRRYSPTPGRRDHERRLDPGDGVGLLAELRHPERVDHVERVQASASTGWSTGSTSSPEVTLLSPGYSNFQANCCAVTAIRSGFGPASSFFASTIALTIGDRGDEHRRDRRPDDLEPRVPVDRRPVRLVLGLHAELEHRVDDRGRHDGEDGDADDGREPERELDPVHLLGGGGRQPGHEHGDHRRQDSREDAVDRDADNRAPAHRGEPTSRRNRSDAPNVCYVAPAFGGTRSTQPSTRRTGNGSWSQHLSDRRRGDPYLGRERVGLGSRAADDRRHPDGRRGPRPRALDDLLVVLGRLRRRAAPDDDVRRGRPARTSYSRHLQLRSKRRPTAASSRSRRRGSSNRKVEPRPAPTRPGACPPIRRTISLEM